ncbi:MAG: hypothetical protein M3430_06700 [Acidobacteriota bacterium]|nr:hypothetical protein [Acidobacteriota bacterium]
MKNPIVLHLSVLTCGLFFMACSKAMPIDTAPQVGMRPVAAQQQSVESHKTVDALQPRLGVIASDMEASRAWQHFIKDGHYRVARADDFNFSESNKAKRYRPYGAGDFNSDHEYDDFAVIVVDTRRNDALRFGLVIFNVREEGKGYDGPFWLYHESDLSRISLTTSSHGPLLVAKHQEDDTTELCTVKWEQQREEYRCNEVQQIR